MEFATFDGNLRVYRLVDFLMRKLGENVGSTELDIETLSGGGQSQIRKHTPRT